MSWTALHLGVPITTTDASGNPATKPNDYLAPGFPGQSKVLADLYYNRYRDFDPTTGRYIQADPIGLEGGQNNYSYVDGNPVNRIDPMGLESREHVTGKKTIQCGKGCWIRIDYVLVDGRNVVRHMHWGCKPDREDGVCGEYGQESHGGDWDDAPEFIKDCARRHHFHGDRPAPQQSSKDFSSPVPKPLSPNNSPYAPTKESWFAAAASGVLILIVGAIGLLAM